MSPATPCEVWRLPARRKSLVFELCTGTCTGFQEESQGRRKKRFHQDDVWDKQGLRKKCGRVKPPLFFACRKQKRPQGAFFVSGRY
ncbi:conserved protein of unknown function [Pseudomonas inefficax]|uniref:Uncharacterized protein n=1 Tax=Pseudomonas inefficax TaxID=2078786 RepID=A0AAQ1SSM8_9PSED|nr:conserved protein of unknown function [Pseudomonas inefficax]